MTYQVECANHLALQVPCPTCGVQANQVCATISGAAARTPHAARRDPFMEAWAEGYLSCEGDYRWSGGPSERILALDTTWEDVLG